MLRIVLILSGARKLTEYDSAAAEMVIHSKSFDNGVICGSENNLVVEISVREDFVAALEAHGAAVLAPGEIERLTAHVIDAEKGRLRREVVGLSASRPRTSLPAVGRRLPCTGRGRAGYPAQALGGDRHHRLK